MKNVLWGKWDGMRLIKITFSHGELQCVLFHELFDTFSGRSKMLIYMNRNKSLQHWTQGSRPTWIVPRLQYILWAIPHDALSDMSAPLNVHSFRWPLLNKSNRRCYVHASTPSNCYNYLSLYDDTDIKKKSVLDSIREHSIVMHDLYNMTKLHNGRENSLCSIDYFGETSKLISHFRTCRMMDYSTVVCKQSPRPDHSEGLRRLRCRRPQTRIS